MPKLKSFEDLPVWKYAAELVVDIYKISSTGKLSKDYGLKDQIQRAIFSVANNISEGFEYNNNKEFIKYLKFAKGSAGEVRSIIIILSKLKFISNSEYEDLNIRLLNLSSQLKGFIEYLKKFEIDKKL